MTIWYLDKEKPQPFDSVLAITNENLMLEVYWNNKSWVCAYDCNEIEIKYWRFLPKFNEDLLHSRKVKKPERTDNNLLRRLVEVSYDEDGKMKVLKTNVKRYKNEKEDASRNKKKAW